MAEYITIKRRVSLDAPISPESLPGFTYMTEHQAHEFIISVRKNGEKETITGSVSANVIRPNGTTIFLQGSISDGDAVVRLHRDCYNIPGRLKISIFNTSGGVTTCIYSATYTNDRSTTDNVIDAGDVVPDLSDVVAKQEEMTQVIADARTATTTANTAAQNVGSIVARPYNPPYKAGKHCTQNGNLYKANHDISTAEEWTASHWTQIVMGDEVTDLKSAIQDIIKMGRVIPENDNVLGEIQSGYYKYSDGTYVSINSLRNFTFSCTPGDVLIVSTWTGGAAHPINFYNGEPSAQTYLGQFDPAYFPAPVNGMYTLSDQVIIVPDGATYAVVNESAYEGSFIHLSVKKVVGLNQELMTAIETMLEIIEPISITVTTGLYSATSGKYASTSVYKNTVLQVEEGQTYLITTTYAGNAHYAIFYNGVPSQETFVGYPGTMVSEQTSIEKYPVTIPAGVTYMAVNCARVTSGTDYALAVSLKTDEYRDAPKQKIYYSLENDILYLVTCYNKNYDLVTVLKKKGNNNLFDFGTFYISPNKSNYPLPSKSGAALIDVGTDFLGPYVVRAVNNIDGDAVYSHHFTGGNHDYTNTGAGGGTATARTTDIRFWIDGKGMTEGEGYCSSVRITWVNYVQAYNTKKADGTGREVLTEKHELVFDGNTWQVYNEITPLEQIVVELYYGMQIALPAPNFSYLRFIGGPNRQQYTTNSGLQGNGDIHSCNMIRGTGSNNSNLAQMTIDGSFDLGKRENCEGPNGMILSGTKGYSVLINQDTTMDQGDIYAFKGTYNFLSIAQ